MVKLKEVSVEGQTGDTFRSPIGKSTIYNRIVGNSNESEIMVENTRTKGLIDTGSMVTTISEKFHQSLNQVPSLYPLEDFELDIRCASGEQLPYSGYTELNIRVPLLSDKAFPILALVVEDTDYHDQVPLVIGTNLIREIRQHYRSPGLWLLMQYQVAQ